MGRERCVFFQLFLVQVLAPVVCSPTKTGCSSSSSSGTGDKFETSLWQVTSRYASRLAVFLLCDGRSIALVNHYHRVFVGGF